VRRWLVALGVLLLGRRRRRRDVPDERIVAEAPPKPGAEIVVLALLGAAALCAGAFIAVYALDRLSHQTQFLGLAIGLAFAFLAAASIVFARNLVANEEHAEPYSEADEHAVEQNEVVQIVDESGDRLTRRRLLKLAAGGAGATVGAALIAPAVSLGPFFDVDPLRAAPWRRSIKLVDGLGRALRADDIEEFTFYTAYAAGASKDDLGSPVVVVRVDPSSLKLPDGRRDWAPDGIVAYSKICTHAGCAVALYRAPHVFPPTAPSRPALICPCHYSTFDPAQGAKVLFGPAGRPLPQLPLHIGVDGTLTAAGPLSGPGGPSWWGVRSGRSRTR
jgi:ubiquinol-cytochrome c reductase iron-sulfur subunit